MSLQIVISFDTTGSMSPCIFEVRRKIQEFLKSIFEQIPDTKIGIIAHGDYCDNQSSYVMKSIAPTDNKAELVSFVDNVEKTDGGDSDECYELVLQHVNKLNWGADHNIFIIIGDANPHEVGYRYPHQYMHLDNPWQAENTVDWKQEAKQLIQKGVKIYPIQCLGRYDSSLFYRTLARLSDTPRLELQQFTNIIPILTGIAYKQQSDTLLQQYGDQLQSDGLLDRNVAHTLNLLLNADKLIGGIELSPKEVNLKAVSPFRFQMLHVDINVNIQSFVESTGAVFERGRGFYELTKTELIQEQKEIVLRDRVTGDMFTGIYARELIGLPFGFRGRVTRLHDSQYDVFVQSTSMNRKLVKGTRFLYEVK